MTKIPLMIDGHEDMAWNNMVMNRCYADNVMTTREREAGMPILKTLGDTMLGWDAYQQGRLGLIFSTLFAAPLRRKISDFDMVYYETAEDAHKIYKRQVEIYHQLVEDHSDKFVLIDSKTSLKEAVTPWLKDTRSEAEHKVGLVILMECADGVRDSAELEQWWEWGVRIIGPAWAGTRFCGGTREPGPLTKEGYALLDGMADLGFALDISHMDEQAVLQAFDHYPGPILASHANAKALLKGTASNRFLTDRVIEGLIERGGIVGLMPNNPFLQFGWKNGDDKNLVSISAVVEQIDHICQIAGNTKHAAFGSDADGGFGWQHFPAEMDSIADLQKLAPLLLARGYTDEDVNAIFYKNWLDMLESFLP